VTETAEQWRRAVEDGLGDADTLVMCCADVSQPLRILGDAFEKRRAGTSLSSPERKHIQSLIDMTKNLSDEQRNILLD
jgi:hypothetical protein